MPRSDHAIVTVDRSLRTEAPNETTPLSFYPSPARYDLPESAALGKTSTVPPKSPGRLGRAWANLTGWIGETGIDFEVDRSIWRRNRSDDLGLGGQPTSSGRDSWLRQDLSEDSLVVPLLLVTFSCALADGITLKYFNTFATSMTGNTVLLAMALFGATARTPIYAAASLVGFLAAGLLFGQLGNIFGNQRRWWLLLTLSFQILILVLAAMTASSLAPLSFQFDGVHSWMYVLLIGIQGGPQVTMAVNAGVRELPTAMMTTPYAALISDPTLFFSGQDEDVRARNRRVIYIVIFWLGAFAGAILARWSSVWIATLVVAGLKVVVCGNVMVQRGSEPVKDDSEAEAEEDADQFDEDGSGNDGHVHGDQEISSRYNFGIPYRQGGKSWDGQEYEGESDMLLNGRRGSVKPLGKASRRSSRDETRVPM